MDTRDIVINIEDIQPFDEFFYRLVSHKIDREPPTTR
jgi:hypothetical protein